MMMEATNKVFKLNFYTQYTQFYIYDKTSPMKTDSFDFWTEEAHSDRLALEDGIIGVGTECYGPVKGEVNILEEENTEVEYSLSDHIVEGSLVLQSGVLQVIDCLGSEAVLEVILKSGTYRVRVYSINLASVDGDEGDDYYKIEIWPAPLSERKCLKRYERNKYNKTNYIL